MVDTSYRRQKSHPRGGAPPESAAVKLIQHRLIELDDLHIIRHRLDAFDEAVGGGDGLNLEILLVAVALGRRQQPHLHQPAAALPPQRLPAEPRRHLAHGQHEEVDEAAGAAAAHGGALRRRAADDLRQANGEATLRSEARHLQQRLPPRHRRRRVAQNDLLLPRHRCVRVWSTSSPIPVYGDRSYIYIYLY